MIAQRQLRLVADFPDHVLWLKGEGPVKPEAIGLSSELCRALEEWYAWWQEIFFDEAWQKDPTSKLDWRFYDAVGVELWKKVRQELAGRYRVAYYSERFTMGFDTPCEIEEWMLDGPDTISFPAFSVP